ncbi:hypothetical protein CLOLEP_03329 [[Clostridium] leptum DSM 753]|uniref:Uncharacterized protein n=1 Tax=[Clostridium] leptum DSM 753 TaxID=428125 RepID=A7VXK4_9FIRM|nr:hypothetical protein CLOLEP_03329 [[Clostridium] leptum DSM 753]
MQTLKTYSNIIIHYRNDFKDNPLEKRDFSNFLAISGNDFKNVKAYFYDS